MKCMKYISSSMYRIKCMKCMKFLEVSYELHEVNQLLNVSYQLYEVHWYLKEEMEERVGLLGELKAQERDLIAAKTAVSFFHRFDLVVVVVVEETFLI